MLLWRQSSELCAEDAAFPTQERRLAIQFACPMGPAAPPMAATSVCPGSFPTADSLMPGSFWLQTISGGQRPWPSEPVRPPLRPWARTHLIQPLGGGGFGSFNRDSY